MLTIWKHQLPAGDDLVDLMLPADPVILSVAEQNGALMMWAQVDDTRPRRARRIFMCSSSSPLNVTEAVGRGARFVGTVPMRNGLVWHVYDGGEP